MKSTDKKTLEEIIRVDHAGERGAIKIYEGQLLALKTIKQDESLKDKIEKYSYSSDGNSSDVGESAESKRRVYGTEV